MPYPTAKYPAAAITNGDLRGPVPDFGNLRLSGVHTAGTTTVTVKTPIPLYWPQPGTLVIDAEEIDYATFSGSVFSTLTRGFNSDVGGGLADAHSDNALVAYRHIGARQNQIHAELIAIESALLNGIAHVLKASTDNVRDLGTSALQWRDIYLGRNIVLGAATAKVVPGATSLSFRNHADSADNLLISDAGLATVRAGLTLSAGALTVSASGITFSDATIQTTAGGPPMNVQTFTASGTWTKPSGAKVVRVIAFGGGGGGGGGIGNAAGNSRGGGGGGGGGARVERTFDASALGATETVTIGAVGTAGVGGAGAGADGTIAGVGGNTTFGSHLTAFGGFGGDSRQSANLGGGGGAGATSAGVSQNGGGPAIPATRVGNNATGGEGGWTLTTATAGGNAEDGGGAGATSSTTDAVGNGGGSSMRAGPGGGSGGVIAAGNTERAGGAGGAINSYASGGGGTGGLVHAAGGLGTSRSLTGKAGDGGGGGGSSSATTGGAGGAGGAPGGGGGGGGGGTTVGGAGGAGGRGEVIVYTW